MTTIDAWREKTNVFSTKFINTRIDNEIPKSAFKVLCMFIDNRVRNNNYLRYMNIQTALPFCNVETAIKLGYIKTVEDGVYSLKYKGFQVIESLIKDFDTTDSDFKIWLVLFINNLT